MTAPLILHDEISFAGGGERVIMELASLLQAEVITGNVAKNLPHNFTQKNFKSLRAYNIPRLIYGNSKTLQLYHAFSKLAQQERPITIFSGQVAVLAQDKIKGMKVLYCHTPPRTIYDKYSTFINSLPYWKRPMGTLYAHIYRHLIKHAISKMDVIIANSETVRKRIENYWHKNNVQVIYPPCGEHFAWEEQRGYYLSVARHDPLKRVEIIVKAFLQMPNKRLVVTSSGIEEQRLRHLAARAKNITFTGQVNEIMLRHLVAGCIATIYIPIDEDFGISPVESMAAGKAVIGVAQGGLLETVVHGITGYLLPHNVTANDIKFIIEKINAKDIAKMRFACEKRASLFSVKKFQTTIMKLFAEQLQYNTNMQHFS